MLRVWMCALALLAALALPTSARADHAGPLAVQWHLDESFPASGPAAGVEQTFDSSGHGLTAYGNAGIPIAANGRFANHLSSTHTGVVQPLTSPLLQPERVTLIGWVQRSGNPGTLRYIAGQGDDGTTCLGSSYALYTGTQASHGLYFYIRPTGPSAVFSPPAGNGVWDGQWHMVAGVYDGSAVRLYIDGAQVGTGTPAPGATINYGFSGNRFYFGSYPDVCPGGLFPGGIDEVRVYRRALTDTELARLAAAPGPAPPDLVPDSSPQPPAPTPTVELPPPVLAKSFNVEPLTGDVFVSVPPAGVARVSAGVPGLKGRRFIPLREARQVPIGSLLDTRKGTVRVQSARNRAGNTQAGSFAAGVFQVLQSRKRSAKGLTELRLKGSSFAVCASASRGRRSSALAGASASRRIRRLRSNTRGRFRTRGRHSSATVRGTKWTVTDRCDGTLTTVQRGSVTVRDFRRKKNIVVKTGKRYLARSRR